MVNKPIGRVLLVVSASVTGCASVQPQASFPEVQQTASERIGKQVRWSNGSDADRAMSAEVDALLSEPLTADAAVQVALLNNRRLQATYENLGVAQADLVQAGLLKNPFLDGDVKFPEGGGGTKIELTVVFDFLDVLYIPMRKSLAETALQGAILDVTGAVLDTAGETRSLFLHLQAAEQMLELHHTVLLAAEASFELARRINEAGNNTKLDVANERAFYEETKLDVAAAEVEAADLRERLTAIMGLWGAQARYTIEPRLPELPTDAVSATNLEKHAIERSIDLAISRRGVALAAQQLGIAKPLGLLSELELGVAFEREADGAHEIGPAFALPIPLFSQGQPALAAAGARLRQAEQRHYALAVEIRSAARSAFTRLTAARQRAEYYRRVVLPLRRTIVEETQKQYNAMFIGGFQLLTAKQNEIEAGRAYIEALRDHWLARAALEQILAGRLPRASQDVADSVETETSSNQPDRGNH